MRIFYTLIIALLFIGQNAHAGYESAAAYNKTTNGVSLLIMQNGKIVFEDYTNGHSPYSTIELASGTKSFSSIIAAAAIQDGLITSLDEKASLTLNEWANDPQKKNISIRQILSLTSGIDTPTPTKNPPTYAEAIKLPMQSAPGRSYEYGPANFQIFGEIMQRKLRTYKNGLYKDPIDYLHARVFNKIGIKPENWDESKDGLSILSMGADISTRDWAKFGQFVLQDGQWKKEQLVDKKALKEITKGSAYNPSYGLAWWLNTPATITLLKESRTMRRATDFYKNPNAKRLPKDLFMAAGAGNQRLYIIPSMNMVIVRQAPGIFADKSSRLKGWYNRKKNGISKLKKFSDVDFLTELLIKK